MQLSDDFLMEFTRNRVVILEKMGKRFFTGTVVAVRDAMWIEFGLLCASGELVVHQFNKLGVWDLTISGR